MDKKNFKPVYIRGTETGKGVIEALIALGGINYCHYNGKCDDYIYYMMPNNSICSALVNSQCGKYIIAIAKEIKPIKWRAARGSTYYFVYVDGCTNVMKITDCNDIFDNTRYDCGNYFRTEAEAKEMAEKIKKILLLG